MTVQSNSNGYQEKLNRENLKGCLAGGEKGIVKGGNIMNMSAIYDLRLGEGSCGR